MIEIFKPIKDFPDYQISNFGNIKSSKYNQDRILVPHTDAQGYLTVYLWSNGKRVHKRINRLVAEEFVPNPNNKPEVGHTDCNRKNNNSENLYWCTHKENMNLLLTRNNISQVIKDKYIYQCIETSDIGCAEELGKKLSLSNPSAISKVANPKDKQHKTVDGFHFVRVFI